MKYGAYKGNWWFGFNFSLKRRILTFETYTNFYYSLTLSFIISINFLKCKKTETAMFLKKDIQKQDLPFIRRPRIGMMR
jgi:hypothetical protein